MFVSSEYMENKEESLKLLVKAQKEYIEFLEKELRKMFANYIIGENIINIWNELKAKIETLEK